MDEESESQQPRLLYPWKARFIVGTLIIILSFFGLVLTDLWQKTSWIYWRATAITSALLCLWLSWHLRKEFHSFSFTSLIRECFLWIAFLGSIFLLSLFVKVGVMGTFAAELSIVTMLAFTLLIAGIYIEPSLLITGIVLALFALGAAYLHLYLYTILLPIAVVSIALLLLLAYYTKK
ncbi:MAG: hypothetical protein WCG10_01400 [Chlamydiota bacterium]